MLHNNYTQDEYKSYHVIIPANEDRGALILGDLNAATDLELIKTHNIKTVITAATGLDHLKIPSELTHIVFPLMDIKTENIEAYFQLSYHTIEENLKKGSVLVHCGAGISRSATLVIAYYMKKYETVFTSAIKHVRKIRPNICPNLGFELQLKKYQKDLGIGQTSIEPPALEKKQISSKKSSVNEAKQMLFTFNIPLANENIKSNRNTTSRSFVKPLSNNQQRKSNLPTQKKNQFQSTQLFVCGKQAGGELKNNSMYEPKNYSIQNNPMMGTWQGNKQTTKNKQSDFQLKF